MTSRSKIAGASTHSILLAGFIAAASTTSIALAQPEKKTNPPASANETKPATPPAAGAAKPEAKPSTPPADPSVDELIKDMQKPGGAKKDESKPAAPAPNGAEPVKAAAPSNEVVPAPSAVPAAVPAKARSAEPGKGRVVREGTFVVSRRGRLVRATSGDWHFAFDSDTQQQPGNDPTMVLMPCEKLMAMERVAEKHGEGVTYTLTGQVFVYRGRNYLLPTNYVVNRPNDNVKPLQ